MCSDPVHEVRESGIDSGLADAALDRAEADDAHLEPDRVRVHVTQKHQRPAGVTTAAVLACNAIQLLSVACR